MNTRWRTVIKLVEKYPSNADYMVSKSSVKNFDTVNIIKSNWLGGTSYSKVVTINDHHLHHTVSFKKK